MGNGKWDEKDTAICLGIGNWLKVNGEAIYAAEKTDLPVQSWGVTTQKGDTLYAHVFEWPKNGKLIIGGLTSEIDNAWLVSDSQKNQMTLSRINGKDLQVHLPKHAIDDMNTVIALTIKQRKPAYPIRLIGDKTNNILYVFDSERMGEGLRFGDGKPNRNYVSNWSRNDQWMEWKARINSTTTYDIYLDYNTRSNKDTGTVLITIDGKNFTVNYTSYPESQGTKSIRVGKIKLNPYEFICTLKGKEFTGNQYLNPIAVRLEKIN